MRDASTNLLLEDIDTKLAVILEGQQAMAGIPRRIDAIEEELVEMRNEMSAIRFAITDQGRELRTVNMRLSRLETAV